MPVSPRSISAASRFPPVRLDAPAQQLPKHCADAVSAAPAAAAACFLVLQVLGLVTGLGLLVTLPASAQSALPATSAADHRLVGTIEGSGFAGAVLLDPSGDQQFFRINETLPDGSRLIKVRKESILVKRPDGMTYEVFVYRELRAAVPSSALTPSVAPRDRDERDPSERRRPPRRHVPSSKETGEE